MPTYAILGGTGNIGSSLIKQLGQAPDTKLRVYARSQSKLFAAHPVLSQPSSPHSVFTGELSDVDLIAKCIAHSDAVFGVVGTNSNRPKLRIAQDLAQVIIAALERLREGSPSPKHYKPPTVVFITSAGITSDKRVRANFPGYLHAVLQTVGKHIYADFSEATAMFRRPVNSWIPVIFFCAPGLTPGPSQGDVRVGIDIPKNAPVYVSHTDLARGMVMAAEQTERWQHREIGIVGAKEPPNDYGAMMWIFVTNIMAVWAPPLWHFGHNRKWWD